MAERRCQQCGSAYFLSDGRPDPKFCSDRCFSSSQADEPAGGSRVFWFFKLALLCGVIAVAMFRYDAASALARHVPEARPYACRALAWLGGEGVDRLLGFALETPGELRGPALEALAQVDDPADAHARVLARLGDLHTLAQGLEPGPRGQLYRCYGACGVTEEIDELISGLNDDRLMLDALHGLSLMHEPRGTQPMIDLLAESEVRFAGKPQVLAEVLLALSRQPDTERNLMSRFFPYLAYETAAVRTAAARAIANCGADYLAMRERLPTVPAADQYGYKQRLARVEKGLAALQAAGPAEKDVETRAALAESVEKMMARPPEWGR